MKAIVFDSGTIINFAMNGILDILKSLKSEFNGKFIITEAVKEEVIDKPLHIKKFELEALMINSLIQSKRKKRKYMLIKEICLILKLIH